MNRTNNFGTQFKNACKKGTNPTQVVQAIANRNKTTATQVWNSLRRQGYAFALKANGQTFWFPTFNCKAPRASFKKTSNNFWQFCIEFCLQQGWIKPEQVNAWTFQQVCAFCSTQLNKHFPTPKGFNWRAAVPGFSAPTANGAARKTASNRISRTRRSAKPKARKTTRTTARKATTSRVTRTTKPTRARKSTRTITASKPVRARTTRKPARVTKPLKARARRTATTRRTSNLVRNFRFVAAPRRKAA